MTETPKPSERQVQRAIIKDLRAWGVGYAHVPNGAYLGGQAYLVMNALKGDGLYPGFPDLIVFKAGKMGLLEVKKEGTGLTKDQPACHAHLAAESIPVAIVRSPLDAFDTLKAWGWL